MISLLVANNYLQSNKTKVLDNLPFLNEGIISFEKASISIRGHFPNVMLQLDEVQLKDTSSSQPIISVQTLIAEASLSKLLRKKVDIKSIRLKGGSATIHTDSAGFNNIERLFQQQLTSKQKNNFSINFNGLKIGITDFAVQLTNALKNQHIQGTIQHLETVLQVPSKQEFVAEIDINLAVDQLAFRKQNGAFLENSQLQGKVAMIWRDSLVQILPSDLRINEESFVFNSIIYTKGEQRSQLNFENEHTRLKQVKRLLSQKIRKDLFPYHITSPFYSKTSIETDFRLGTNPIIKVDFELKENDVEVFNIEFNKSTLKGRFINRLNDDGWQTVEPRGNIRVLIEDLTVGHSDFLLQSPSLAIKSTKEKGANIQSSIKIKGKAKDISEWLENDQFFFEKGNFDLTAHINGSLRDMNSIFIESDANFSLGEFSVYYQPGKVAFPFQSLTLEKKVGDAFFTIKNNSFVKGHQIDINGALKNFSALLIELYQKQVSSEINIVTKKLSWQNFLDAFGENEYLKNSELKTRAEKKKSMKATISGFKDNFQPHLAIKIDTLLYSDELKFLNFKTDVYFGDEHIVVLENAHFDFDGSSIDFNARLDFSETDQTPFSFDLEGEKVNLQAILPKFNFFNLQVLENIEQYPEDASIKLQHQGVIDDHKGLIPNTGTGNITILNNENKKGKMEATYQSNYQKGMPLEQMKMKTKLYLEGSPANFNSFFKTEQFFFKNGTFKANFEYEGDFYSIQDLLEDSKVTFSLRDGEVFYRPASVVFPLTQIDLAAHDNHADFNFLLQHDALSRDLIFGGKLENLSELLVGETGNRVHTAINIFSSKLLTNELIHLFRSDNTSQTEQSFTTVKKTLTGILNTFDPVIQVSADTVQYSDLVSIENFVTGIHLQDSLTLVLDKTGFDFQNSNLNFNGQITLNESAPMPFQFQLHTTDFDIGRLLKELDYLAIPVLKDMEKLSGRLTMNLHLSGEMQAEGEGLITDATRGVLDFRLDDLELKGLAPLEVIASKLRMKRRFKELYFAPIINTLYFNGNTIEIPLMEIQSNALHLFIEGIFSQDDATNLWISIPFDNFKITDRTVIPPKTGYAAVKHKFYLESFRDKKGKLKIKFRPTKRKYYKRRGILDQYRADKRKNRAIRRAMRKGS